MDTKGLSDPQSRWRNRCRATVRRPLAKAGLFVGIPVLAIAAVVLWLARPIDGGVSTQILVALGVASLLLVLQLASDERNARSDRQLDLSSRTSFDNADLAGLDLSSRYLRDRTFRGARLSKANGTNVDLSGSSFPDARLTQARFQHSILAEADLSTAHCYEARFDHSNLSRANLDHAMLQHASFRRADLSGATLRHAQIQGCDFTRAILDPTTNFQGAIYSDGTRFPAGTAPPGAVYDGSRTTARSTSLKVRTTARDSGPWFAPVTAVAIIGIALFAVNDRTPTSSSQLPEVAAETSTTIATPAETTEVAPLGPTITETFSIQARSSGELTIVVTTGEGDLEFVGASNVSVRLPTSMTVSAAVIHSTGPATCTVVASSGESSTTSGIDRADCPIE